MKYFLAIKCLQESGNTKMEINSVRKPVHFYFKNKRNSIGYLDFLPTQGKSGESLKLIQKLFRDYFRIYNLADSTENIHGFVHIKYTYA